MLDKPAGNQPISKESPEYQQLLTQYSDRNWRINNLYFILDEDGQKVRYKRRAAQLKFALETWVLDIIVKARQLGFCLSPKTKLLTSDLQWLTLDEVEVGQKIMAVDETASPGRGGSRRLREAVIEKKWDVLEEAFEIEFETGLKITATGPHRFMGLQRGGCAALWRRISETCVGDHIRVITDPWGSQSYEDGWFGGLLDGEGSMRQKPAGGYEICVAQVEGDVLERARKYLVNNHIPFSESIDRRKGEKSKIGNKPVHKLSIYRAGDGMRLLGKCRPSRFNRQWWIGRKLPGDGHSWLKIVSIRSVGRQRMIDIQTSEKTFIAEGLISHNSSEIAIDITDLCVFKKNIQAGIIDYTLDDAKKKLQKIKFAYEGLPAHIRRAIPLLKNNEDEIWFGNGSQVTVGTSHRGGTLQYLHVSEFGKIATDKPDTAREIIAGALSTLAPGQQIKIESTAHGTSGSFYDLVQKAEKMQKERKPLSTLDFKLHFFAWWMDPKYRLPAGSIPITIELQEYFKDLKLKQSIHLDAEQMTWYAGKYAQIGEDDMRSEFPSHMAETFFNSLEGTWFKKQMTAAREERRVGYPISFDPSRPVNTFWDIGVNEISDQNGIIFHQTDGVRHRIIDYYENANEGIQHYAKEVKIIGERRGFTFGMHYGPHDIDRREWGSDARNRKDIAADLGIKFTIVDRVLEKEDAIEAARAMLNLTWIDSEHCQRLVDALDNYRKTWNKLLAQWTRKSLHNWASTGADCLMTGACGLKPEKVPSASRSKKEPRRGSQWSN